MNDVLIIIKFNLHRVQTLASSVTSFPSEREVSGSTLTHRAVMSWKGLVIPLGAVNQITLQGNSGLHCLEIDVSF